MLRVDKTFLKSKKKKTGGPDVKNSIEAIVMKYNNGAGTYSSNQLNGE